MKEILPISKILHPIHLAIVLESYIINHIPLVIEKHRPITKIPYGTPLRYSHNIPNILISIHL